MPQTSESRYSIFPVRWPPFLVGAATAYVLHPAIGLEPGTDLLGQRAVRRHLDSAGIDVDLRMQRSHALCIRDQHCRFPVGMLKGGEADHLAGMPIFRIARSRLPPMVVRHFEDEQVFKQVSVIHGLMQPLIATPGMAFNSGKPPPSLRYHNRDLMTAT